MNSIESSEGQELQNLGSGAWDNPAYSGHSTPRGTLRICTISSAVPPTPEPKKPEDGPQGKAHGILVSSCCLQMSRSIRGRVLLGYWSQETGHQKLLGWGMWSEEEVSSPCLFGVCELSVSELHAPEHKGQSSGPRGGAGHCHHLEAQKGMWELV